MNRIHHSQQMATVNHVTQSSNEWPKPALALEEQGKDQSRGHGNLLSGPNSLDSFNNSQDCMDLNVRIPSNELTMKAAPSIPSSLPQNDFSIGLGMTTSINASPGAASTHAINSPDRTATHFSPVDLSQTRRMRVPQADALPPVTHDIIPVECPPLQNSLGNSALTDPSSALTEIGSIVDEMATIAEDARKHFHLEQFDKSSDKIESLKTMIRRVGDIGVMSINYATNYQHQPGSSIGTPIPSQTLSPEHERQLLNASLFSTAADGFEPRKRRTVANEALEVPSKVLRNQSTRARSRSDLSDVALHLSHMENKWGASSLVSPTFQSSQFDFQLNPASYQTQFPTHSTFKLSDATTTQSVLPSRQPENVIPVVSEQAQVVASGSPLPAAPTNDTPGAKLMGLLGPINEGQAEPNLFPAFSMALNLALEQPPSDTWQGDNNTQAMSSTPMTNNDSLENSNFLDATDDGWENFTMMDRTAGGTTELSPELRVIYDKVFHEYLNSLCSNLEAKDERGELIHQTLMPKKMARLDESPDFRPFKFRIQAFTNAFQSELQRQGLSEDDASMKRIKPYLWTHPYISRFNEDGKKAKSKGNHIWNVEARRLPGGGWEFFAFAPKITGATSKVAYVGERWSWNLRIWDPQGSNSNIKVVYSANTIPQWLHWEEDEKVLAGIPQNPSESGEVSVTALYVQFGQLHRLEHSFFLQVLPSKVENQTAGEPSAPTSEVPPAQQPAELYASQPFQAPALAVGMSGTHPEMQKHEVVEPSHAPDVLSSIPFPFTPPVYMDKVHRPFHFDPSSLSGQTANPQRPGSAFSGSATRPQTVVFVNKTSSHGVAPSIPNAADVRTSPTAPMSLPVSNDSGVPATPHIIQEHEPSSMLQLWNSIERRQQEQAASLMLLMPQRPQAFSLNEHPGQGTPISNMPRDMSANLPQLSPNPPS